MSAIERRPLGATGIAVSALGLGAGGASRLGLARGATTDEAAQLVCRAVDLGVNYVDTAPAYGTEQAVGQAIRSVGREALVVSTKVRHRSEDGTLYTAGQLRDALTGSLRALGTDHVDVYFLHGVRTDEYAYCRDVLAPVLADARDAGMVRAIGVTEPFGRDPSHEMQHQALADGLWDVLLTGVNVLNPSARQLVSQTQDSGVGIVAMHAIRWLLTDVGRLRSGLRNLLVAGARPEVEHTVAAVLDCLDRSDLAEALPAAGYRFVLDLPGFSSVLIGTGNQDHLESNIEAITEVGHDGRAAELMDLLDGMLAGEPAGSGDRIAKGIEG